jgi:rhamnosyltransferase
MATKMNNISVIIRTKNEERWLDSCLFAVNNQDINDLEIILVDNESTDRTLDIAKYYKCVILHISDQDFNYSKALNQGIDASSGSLIAILSGHCIPVNDQWLSCLSMHFLDNEVGAVFGRQEPLPDSNPVDKRDLWTTFGLDRKIQKRDYFFHNANSMIRRSIWERQPFNEKINGVEDREWAKKVLQFGRKIIYEPLASVFHHHGIHHSGNEQRAARVVRMIEAIQQDNIEI